MHTLVKTACAIHNLALATALGGPLFVKIALKRAVIKEIPDEKQRGRLLACAGTRFNKVNVPAHLVFTGTWLIERKAIKNLGVDRRTRRLVGIKDVLVGGALITGLANVAVFNRFKKDFPEGAPVRDGTSSDPKLAKYQRYYRVMGPLHLVLLGGSLAIGPFIAGSIIRAARKGLLARMLEKK
jgi:hypothetical protein